MRDEIGGRPVDITKVDGKIKIIFPYLSQQYLTVFLIVFFEFEIFLFASSQKILDQHFSHTSYTNINY